jgi:outer membrane protein, heavy metal efflux system
MRASRHLILRSGAAIGLALLLGAGCVHYSPRPITPQASLDALEARRLDDPALGAYLQANHEPLPSPGQRWSLRALTLVAFFYHPDLDVARAELAAAEVGTVSAGERENPSLTLSSGYNTTTPTSLITPWILGFGLDIPITTAGKRGHRIAQARSLAEVARWRVASTAWQVRSRVRASLVDLGAAAAAESVQAEAEAIQQEIVSLLEKQLEAGEVSPLEVTRAHLALAATRLARQEAEARRRAARVALAEALGVTDLALEDVAVDDLATAAADVPAAAARREALLNRADVLGALAEYEASQAALQLEIARQYPDIHLGPGFERDQNESKWSLSLSLPLPIVSRNRGPIAEAEARRTAAAARFLAVQAQALAEVDQAIEAFDAARQASATAEGMVADLDTQERAARVRFEAGEISRLDLDTARLERVTAELARQDARVRAQETLGRMEDVMQRPAEPLQWPATTPERGDVPAAGGSKDTP